eukprot:7627496-Pyramimonas_sp.AAC.1
MAKPGKFSGHTLRVAMGVLIVFVGGKKFQSAAPKPELDRMSAGPRLSRTSAFIAPPTASAPSYENAAPREATSGQTGIAGAPNGGPAKRHLSDDE